MQFRALEESGPTYILGSDVLEVGPGPGGSTDLLHARVARLTCVEADRRFLYFHPFPNTAVPLHLDSSSRLRAR
jgi:hypothetical protein